MRSVLVSAMALFLAVQLHSQVRGHVWDQGGGPIRGATVILKSSSGNKEIAKVFTDHNGEYWLNTSEGEYLIEASAECFVLARYRSFYTMYGRTRQFDFVLPVADCGGDAIDPDPPPRSKVAPLDLCDVLSDLPKYKDKTVAIRGEFIVHDHGRVIVKDKCPSPLITSGHTWPTMISLELSPNTKEDAPCRLAMVTAPPKTQFWVTIDGRLETREHFEMVLRGDGKTVPNGYGHLNAFPAQLVYSHMRDCTWKTRDPSMK